MLPVITSGRAMRNQPASMPPYEPPKAMTGASVSYSFLSAVMSAT